MICKHCGRDSDEEAPVVGHVPDSGLCDEFGVPVYYDEESGCAFYYDDDSYDDDSFYNIQCDGCRDMLSDHYRFGEDDGVAFVRYNTNKVHYLCEECADKRVWGYCRKCHCETHPEYIDGNGVCDSCNAEAEFKTVRGGAHLTNPVNRKIIEEIGTGDHALREFAQDLSADITPRELCDCLSQDITPRQSVLKAIGRKHWHLPKVEDWLSARELSEWQNGGYRQEQEPTPPPKPLRNDVAVYYGGAWTEGAGKED